MTAIMGDSCRNTFKDILEDQFREKIYNSFINDAVLPVLKDVMAYSHDIVDALESSNQSPAVACGPDCSYCCHSQIHVLPIEALLILSSLKAFVLKSGSGTLMLLELCRKADCFNVRLSVNPALNPNSKSSYRDFNVLRKWHEQFEFKGDSCLCRVPRQG
ncbi:MAG: hypothetical protein MI799_09940 [Desulfobacterales bacterium]|nr:hypothetical protein [Desulfobacterales bacterium]